LQASQSTLQQSVEICLAPIKGREREVDLKGPDKVNAHSVSNHLLGDRLKRIASY